MSRTLHPASPVSRAAVYLVPLLLAACGGREQQADADEPMPVRTADVAGLPAPAPGGGSITGAPPAPPAPGEVQLQGDPPQEAWIRTDGTDGLPPLEDNPEAGLAEIVPVPLPIVTPATEPTLAPAPAVAEASPAPAVAPATAPDGGQAASVVQAYYAAIGSRDYRSAYALWSDGGRASGQSPEQFAAGFAATQAVEVQLGNPAPASGSGSAQYVRVPVAVVSTQVDGSTRRFAGHYMLRKADAGGTGAWRITAAELQEERL